VLLYFYVITVDLFLVGDSSKGIILSGTWTKLIFQSGNRARPCLDAMDLQTLLTGKGRKETSSEPADGERNTVNGGMACAVGPTRK
jgi:hypothetical protein